MSYDELSMRKMFHFISAERNILSSFHFKMIWCCVCRRRNMRDDDDEEGGRKSVYITPALYIFSHMIVHMLRILNREINFRLFGMMLCVVVIE
jgi:hypothetical protein